MNSFEKIHLFLAKLAGSLKDKRILDYGSGTGGLIKVLQDQLNDTSKIFAVDSDPKMLEKTKNTHEALISNGTLSLQEASSPKAVDGSFDIIFCHNVLECVDKKNEFLNSLHDKLAPSGQLILSHADFDSVIYNHSEKDLTRKLIHLYADTRQHEQGSADGQMGRKLRGHLFKSKLAIKKLQILRVTETQFNQEHYGYHMAHWLLSSAAKSISPNVLKSWLKELETLSTHNEYFFAIDIMIANTHQS